MTRDSGLNLWYAGCFSQDPALRRPINLLAERMIRGCVGREFVPEHLADAPQSPASKDQDPASVLVDDGSLLLIKMIQSECSEMNVGGGITFKSIKQPFWAI